ncbi:MAG: hypothetical protein CK425_12410 [Parachlamydia sp.]|nr:MAG: hypothetical protein CK425_12410 [Parachlamydia sp.]
MSYETQNFQNDETINGNEEAVNDLLYRIAHSFEKKYKVNTIATNVAMPRGIVKLLGLDFQVRGPLSKEEIRKILIALSQDFLVSVNSDEAIKPYLENYPFEIKNIEITLFFMDSRNIRLNDPYLGIAGISRGKLDYQILITTDIPSIKSEFDESYEEALQALNRKEI